MIEVMAAADQRRLEEMNAAAKVVADTKAELETEKAGLEGIKEELKATQTNLEDRRATADQLLADLIATGEAFEVLMEQSEDEQAKLMEEIAAKEEEYEDAKYLEWLATSVPETVPSYSGGIGTGNTVNGVTWLIPINYTRFSSPFGMRWHPVYGGWRMHYGVDLSAPSGTPIYASRGGVITTASYQEGGAGYYVSINHGDGYSSIYMHMTKYNVQAGQYVEAGEVIGYVGTSGGSTGYHLHFGIAYNGTYVDPQKYIKT